MTNVISRINPQHPIDREPGQAARRETVLLVKNQGHQVTAEAIETPDGIGGRPGDHAAPEMADRHAECQTVTIDPKQGRALPKNSPACPTILARSNRLGRMRDSRNHGFISSSSFHGDELEDVALAGQIT